MILAGNERAIGLIVGILVGLAIVPIILMKINKDNRIRTEFDEMQELIRGKAYKYAFYTGTIYTALLLVLQMLEVRIPARQEVVYFSVIFVSLAVWIVYCVMKGAYFGINNDKKRFYFIMYFISLINILVPIMHIIDGTFIQDGIVTDSCINLMCGILFLIIGICGAIRNGMEKKEGAEDEES